MVELSIEISEDLRQRMKEIPGIDWSSVIAAFVSEKVFEWARLHSILDKSELTEKQALDISREINEKLAKKYKQLLSSK